MRQLHEQAEPKDVTCLYHDLPRSLVSHQAARLSQQDHHAVRQSRLSQVRELHPSHSHVTDEVGAGVEV